MTAAIIVAVIALLGAIASAALALFGQRWQFRATSKQEATALVRRYREPLASAAFELQSRLWNLVCDDYLAAHGRRGGPVAEYAVTSTLWRFGQYFGWVEILRREVQFLDLGTLEETQRLRDELVEVRRVLQSDRRFPDDKAFQVLYDEQRAIGEIMIVSRGTDEDVQRSDCLGYAEFLEHMGEDGFRRWFARLEDDVAALADQPRGHPRLEALQSALATLVRDIDREGTRFPEGELSGISEDGCPE
jgi:hypothetical protein